MNDINLFSEGTEREKKDGKVWGSLYTPSRANKEEKILCRRESELMIFAKV